MRIAAPFAGFLFLLFVSRPVAAQKDKLYDLASPGGLTVVSITTGPGGLSWSVRHSGQPVLTPSGVGLQLETGDWLDGRTGPVKVAREAHDQWIAAFHYKKDSIRDRYNQLTLSYPKGGYGIVFRAYDDGAAYRWVTSRKDSLTIRTEKAEFNFPSDEKAWIPYVNDPNPDIYTTSFENFYRTMRLSEFVKDTLAFLPVRVDIGNGEKAAILEADLADYPGMFVTRGGGAAAVGGANGSGGGFGLTGRFAPFPLSSQPGGHNGLQMLVKRRAGFLAATAGTRTFPWRIVLCTDHDRELTDNDMVYRLASPSRVVDTSWIQPGKVAWDWWNDWNISHVDFRAGINTATYKYYVDFAAANHIDYILLDEGWSDPTDLMKIVPDIDLPAIIAYARERNVGVWLWAGMMPLDTKMEEVMDRYSKMGIKGFKVDFMNRDDQVMVGFYYRAAREAAGHHLMLDFHGAYKPTGLQRTYPNVLNFEGVRGMENEKWTNEDFPGYDVSIPFIRMLAGPMDYTPGAMKNYNKANFRPIFSEPESQGTRCHQLAMYIVYEAPFAMLSDNPTNYMREPESVRFIADVPTTFDETRAIDGSVGEYVAVARRKGNDWYVGAMTNWTERDLTLDLSFLPPGVYHAEIIRDGVNADRDGTDYKVETISVTGDRKMTVHLAPGGGWVAKISADRGTSASTANRLVPPPMIDVNQVGFSPGAPKLAVVTGTPVSDRFFVISSRVGDTVFSGTLGPVMKSSNSSLISRVADFTPLKSAGEYHVSIPGMDPSYAFRVGRHIYVPVVKNALKGFYYQRSGMVLTAEYGEQWSRPAGHPDTAVIVHPSAANSFRSAGTVISSPGGWYDAGDYNKYIVNSGITMGTLLDAYEDFPAFYDTLRTNIPPIFGVPDLLNEALYNLRWMLTMQDPSDGGVYHKCTNAVFDGMVMPGVTKAPRYVVQKGTAATLDFSAVMAQAARIFSKFTGSLPGFSDSCKQAAIRSWGWAQRYPDSVYDQNALNRAFQPAISTGAYGDRHFEDEWYWAACELWMTTLDGQYYPTIGQHFHDALVLPSWSNVATMGTLTLLRCLPLVAGPSKWLDSLGVLRGQLLSAADGFLQSENRNAFHTVIGGKKSDFVWGSNSVAANQGIVLIYAWLQTRNRAYLDAALNNLDYLLGRNATGYCFITGLGSHSPMHPHHRPSAADGIAAPVPGLLAGGPNPGQQDHQHYAYSEPETSYTDQDQAYASNEIAINWNAPLVYLAGAIAALEDKL